MIEIVVFRGWKMSNTEMRFETREAINNAIMHLVESGILLEDVDVELCRIGVVDLDLCVDCLNEMALTLAANEVAAALDAA